MCLIFILRRLSHLNHSIEKLPSKLEGNIIPSLRELVAEVRRFADSTATITNSLSRLESRSENHARMDEKDHRNLAEKVKDVKDTLDRK